MHLETISVHAGRSPDPSSGAVAPPIVLSSTFARGADGQPIGVHTYGRVDNPNRHALETCLAALEQGHQAISFSSGVAAATAMLRTLHPGDHLLVPLDLYHGNRLLMRDVMTPWGLRIEPVDFTNLTAVSNATTQSTRLLWAETPSNPRLQICDISALADLAQHNNALLVVDNTFATPVLQKPLSLGADAVIHSSSKYFGGHSDVIGGAVVLRENGELADRLRRQQITSGAIPSPFDCWLLLRSLSTLPLRVRTQAANALRLAKFLQRHPGISEVTYPGLRQHPGHDLASKQMQDGYGAVLSFRPCGGKAAAFSVVSKVRLFTRATSLGGVESLIEHRASSEGAGTTAPEDLLRVSVGIEHHEDLTEDLRHALE